MSTDFESSRPRRIGSRSATLLTIFPRRGLCAALASALALAGAGSPARAAWAPYRVFNQTASQTGQQAVSDGSGGAIVAWADSRGGVIGVYAQHLLPSDAVDPAWPLGGRFLGGMNDGPAIAPDGAGGAIVAWEGQDNDLHAQHVLASGGLDPAWPAGGVLVCSAPGNQVEVRAVSDGAGGAILAWTDYRNEGTSSSDIFAQRVRSTGVVDPAWPANGVAVCAAADLQNAPVAIGDGSGGVIVSWEDFRNGSDYDIFAQRLLDTGAVAPGWTAGGVLLCGATGHQTGPVLCADGAGGGIVEWSDDRSGLGLDVYAMRIRSTGSTATGWHHFGEVVSAAAFDQQVLALIPDGSGGAISAWSDGRAGNNDRDIYVQRMTASGAAAWTADGVVVADDANSLIDPNLATDGSGGAFVAWHRLGGGPIAHADLFVQHLLSAGSLDPSWPIGGGRVTFDTQAQTGSGHRLAMASDGSGSPTVVWDGSPDKLCTINVSSSWTALVPLTVAIAGGSGSVDRDPELLSYPQGSSVTLTASPAAGYGFVNWSGGATGSSNPLVVIMSGAKNITANFAGYPVTLTVSPAATGTLSKSPDQATYAPGTQVTLTASGAFPFLGWSGDASGNANPLVLTMDGPKSVTGSFEAYALTTSVSPPGAGAVTRDPQAQLYPPGPVTLTAAPISGYEFASWSGDASGSTNPVVVDVDGNKSVTASFTLIPPACGDWSLVTIASGARAQIAAAWDPVNARVLRVGGGPPQGPLELWQLTIAGGWAQVTTSGVGPVNRTGPGFVFDSARNRMLLIGGMGTLSPRDDVWELSLSGTPTWTQLAPAGLPPSRSDFTTLYDPVRDRVIRFGGIGGGTLTNEAWALSLSGPPTWTQLSPSGSAPPPRAGHVAIYDPVRDRMIIHGGFGGSPATVFDDTWALSLSGSPAWTPIAAQGTAPPVFYSAAIYDPLRDRLMVISGAGPSTDFDADHVWSLSLATEPFWSTLPPGRVNLVARAEHAAVYEPDLDLVLAFNGVGNGGVLSDTKRLDCAGGWWLQAGGVNGMVQVNPTQACYADGEHVTLVASPSGGAMFDHWIGDASGNANPLDVTMDASKTIFAEMVPRATDVVDVPLSFALGVRPNPSAGPVAVEYSLPREASVRLRVFDVAGREVARLAEGSRPAGVHVVAWDTRRNGSPATTGIYFVRFETPAGTWTRRVALLR